jgi:hypothetical protein
MEAQPLPNEVTRWHQSWDRKDASGLWRPPEFQAIHIVKTVNFLRSPVGHVTKFVPGKNRLKTKNNVSDTVTCLHPRAKSTLLAPISGPHSDKVLHEDRDKIPASEMAFLIKLGAMNR